MAIFRRELPTITGASNAGGVDKKLYSGRISGFATWYSNWGTVRSHHQQSTEGSSPSVQYNHRLCDDPSVLLHSSADRQMDGRTDGQTESEEYGDEDRYKQTTSCYLIRVSSRGNNTQAGVIDNVIACLTEFRPHIHMVAESVFTAGHAVADSSPPLAYSRTRTYQR